MGSFEPFAHAIFHPDRCLLYVLVAPALVEQAANIFNVQRKTITLATARLQMASSQDGCAQARNGRALDVRNQ